MSGLSKLPRLGGLRELPDPNVPTSNGQAATKHSVAKYDTENVPTKSMLPPPKTSVVQQENASKRKYADDGAQQAPVARSAIAKAPKTPTRSKTVTAGGSLRLPQTSARPGSSMGQSRAPGPARPAYMSQQTDNRPSTAMGFSNPKSLVQQKAGEDNSKMEESIRALTDRLNEMERKNEMEVVVLKTKCTEVETNMADVEAERKALKAENERLAKILEDEQRRHRNELDDEARKLRNESDDLRRRHIDEVESLKRAHRDEISQLTSKSREEQDRAESSLRNVKSALEDEKLSKLRETTEIKTRLDLELDAERKSRVQEVAELKSKMKDELEEERSSRTKEVNDIKARAEKELEAVKTATSRELSDLKSRSDRALDEEKAARVREVTDLKSRLEREMEAATGKLAQELKELQLQSAVNGQRHQQDVTEKDRQIGTLKQEVALLEKSNMNLKEKLAEQSSNCLSLESTSRALRERVLNLEAVGKDQNDDIRSQETTIEMLQRKLGEAQAKLRTEETLRRKLHNQVLELKGNIRVFCRVRPPLAHEVEPAKIDFPDQDKEAKDIVLQGKQEKTALGNIVMKPYSFSFDKVFSPACQNPEIFEEISQLVQSALDGYNVCIFCYGQTGSGKTYTMTSSDGMIPLAVAQIYRSAADLEEKGWVYKMEGSFIEVYNETLNDLLGSASDLDRKKHEIRHDNGRTTVTGCTTMVLDSPESMEEVMRRASENRSVAATKANERSSRSHSVFILKLIGENSITGEKSEGVLNLVDLAGSERLSHSQATGDRLKETQNINKSLSSLGDVICALGSSNGKEKAHIPYRNSKLTYLLQNSLGGNSKTLMFVMVSPLQAHMNETVTSLTFATKVSNTYIGTAKRIPNGGSKIKFESEDTINIREQANFKYIKEN